MNARPNAPWPARPPALRDCRTCRDCPRLAGFLAEVKAEHPSYVCEPVPAFGDPRAALLIVGLAPGLHGANATGRPFTGDGCSDFLYGALHRAGLASAPRSVSRSDGLVLQGCRITNAVKCLPPQNKPSTEELKACGQFLQPELQDPDLRVVLSLGALAHAAVLRAVGEKPSRHGFAHGAVHQLPDHGLTLVDSYHPSRYNLNTGRIDQPMFDRALALAWSLAQPAAMTAVKIVAKTAAHAAAPDPSQGRADA